jgi:PmbA protein
MGVGAIEIQSQATSALDAGVELAQISSVNKSVGTEFAIRLYYGKRMGSAFTNIPTKDALDEAVRLAVSAARATTEDKDWLALPEAGKYKTIRGLWQESVTKCEPSWVVELLADAVSRAKAAEEGLMPAFGSAGVQAAVRACVNSGGVSVSEKGTLGYLVLVGVAQTESVTTPMIDSYDVQRSLQVDVPLIVEDIASMIRVCKNTAKGGTGKQTVVLHPNAYSSLLQYTLLQSVRGDNVARGKSKIADKIGDRIASDILTIYDDGTAPRGVNTTVADDEGVPRQRTSLIEKGVLRSFLWDTYWANRKGVKSTGNAKRNMRQGLVDIATSNLVVSPGKREISDIISEIKHGYLIRDVQGAHSSNPESGDFSVVGNPAIIIEDGRMVGAAHGLMVAGNIYSLLGSAVEVAKTPRYLAGTIGPEIVFRDVDVIAKE